MRDPTRIPIILDRIKKIWERDPDLRLGQLILIACQNMTPVWPDVFSVEDDALLAGLDEYEKISSQGGDRGGADDEGGKVE